MDHVSRRNALAERCADLEVDALLVSNPHNVAWAFNIRGADVPRNPILHGLAILHDDARVTLFAESAKFDEATRAHLGAHVAQAGLAIGKTAQHGAAPTGRTP